MGESRRAVTAQAHLFARCNANIPSPNRTTGSLSRARGIARPPHLRKDSSMLRKLPTHARRRLSDEPLFQVTPGLLVQPMDVDLGLPENAQVPVKSIPGWFTYGAAAALERMMEGHRLGVQEFVLRISDSTPGLPPPSRLDRHASTAAELVNGAPEGVHCTVDPFALALNPDSSWGVYEGGGIDAAATYALVQDVAAAVASCGAHGIVTLGRLPREVHYTKKGIKSVSGTT